MRARVFFAASLAVLCVCSLAVGREWTDRSGQTVDGQFVRYDNGNVVILVVGKIQSIPFDDLSDTDQQFVRQTLEAKGQGDLLPPPTGGANPSDAPTVSEPATDPPAPSTEPPATPPTPPPTTPPPTTTGTGARTWTDLAGNTFQGTFTRTTQNAVVIRQQAGASLQINCEFLSITDQDFIVQQLNQRDPVSDGRDYRIWSYNTGANQAVARFESHVGPSVRLRQEGIVFQIPYTQLSPADQLYVQQATGATTPEPSPAVVMPDPAVTVPPPAIAPPPTSPPVAAPTREPWPVGQPAERRIRDWNDMQGNSWQAEYYDVSIEGFVSFNDPIFNRQWAVHFYDMSEPDQQFIRDDLRVKKKAQQEEEEDEDRIFHIKETYHPPLWTYFLFGASVLALVIAIIIKVIERLMSAEIS